MLWVVKFKLGDADTVAHIASQLLEVEINNQINFFNLRDLDYTNASSLTDKNFVFISSFCKFC